MRGGRLVGEAVVVAQGVDQQGDVGLQFASRRIGTDGRRLGEAGGVGSLQPEADHADPAAVGLVRGERFEGSGEVGPGGGEGVESLDQRAGAPRGVERDREQVVEAVAPVEMAVDRRSPQPQERAFRDIGGDERIAVAIAPHPRSEREKGRNVERLARIACCEAAAERGMHLRHRLPQPWHDRQPAFHLIEHGRPRGPEKLRLPEHVEFAVEVAFVR